MASESGGAGASKKVGGRPARYADDDLLVIVAEYLAWPEETGVRTQEQAIDKAIRLVLGSDQWTEQRFTSTLERIRKKYQKAGPRLEAASKSRAPILVMHNGQAFPYQGPQLPQLLSAPPDDPEIALARARAAAMIPRLRRVAESAADIADALEGQIARGEVPDWHSLLQGDHLISGGTQDANNLCEDEGE